MHDFVEIPVRFILDYFGNDKDTTTKHRNLLFEEHIRRLGKGKTHLLRHWKSNNAPFSYSLLELIELCSIDEDEASDLIQHKQGLDGLEVSASTYRKLVDLLHHLETVVRRDAEANSMVENPNWDNVLRALRDEHLAIIHSAKEGAEMTLRHLTTTGTTGTAGTTAYNAASAAPTNKLASSSSSSSG
eukprot:CAMPEP_0170176710 /NCGR_PEP_ID=MMETSP0040_2-20121228/9530_1 /TAXON_ID=641309 /ORGANISM="Lotharella oceanica, Strain CCMP622" /LENGTH=186 /DNA_ID=CAMNT_0010419127 /DNA_START=172 /DNA_END=733 /DNA_ORIENTATION=-